MSGSGVQYYFEATVIDGDGNPVEGATVSIQDGQSSVEVEWGDGTNETDSQGVAGGLVFNGQYTAHAEYEDESGAVLQGSTGFTIESDDVQFDIVLGQDGSTGSSGEEDTGNQQQFGGAEGTTDTDGIFNFEAPDGEYRISAQELAGGTIPSFELNVIDGNAGPVEGATITAENADGEPVEGFSVQTDAQGGAEVNIEAGTYTFIAESDGQTGSLEYIVDNHNEYEYITLGQDSVAENSGVTTGEVTVSGSGLDIQVQLGGEVTVSESETQDGSGDNTGDDA